MHKLCQIGVEMIETKRLILRAWQESDLAPFAEINACQKVCEFLPKQLSREESDALVQRLQGHMDKHGYSFFAVELKEANEFIGFTGLFYPSFDAHFTPAVEIGWRLSSSHWGQGYAPEAAKAALNYGFYEVGLEEIVAITVPDNMKSRRVMEKIGMVCDPDGDFMHPSLPDGHPLRRHVLYRICK